MARSISRRTVTILMVQTGPFLGSVRMPDAGGEGREGWPVSSSGSPNAGPRGGTAPRGVDGRGNVAVACTDDSEESQRDWPAIANAPTRITASMMPAFLACPIALRPRTR